MFLSVPAFATITISAAPGASNLIIPTTTTGTTGKPRILGGFIDSSPTPCAASDSSVCDTCKGGNGADTAVFPCNKATASPNGSVTIVAHTDAQIAVGTVPFIRLSSASAGSSSLGINPVALDGSGNFSVTAKWDVLCNGNCAASSTTSFTIGLSESEKLDIEVNVAVVSGAAADFYDSCEDPSQSTTGDGFCHVTMYPGDKKAYAKDLTLAGSSVSSPVNGVNWTGVVFFYSKIITDEATTLGLLRNTSDSKVLSYDNTKSPPDVDKRVTDLENNEKYCFTMANQDEAGNIYKTTNLAGGAGSLPGGTPFTAAMCVTPDEVVGLLDDKRCFIATAAFGSPFEEHVATLRLFRDRVMKSSEIGNELVEFYYKWSPELARWIAHRDTVRAVVRAGLLPVVGLASLSLEFGFAPTMFAVFALIAAAAVSLVAWRRRRNA